jgi:hypothetical protein
MTPFIPPYLPDKSDNNAYWLDFGTLSLDQANKHRGFLNWLREKGLPPPLREWAYKTDPADRGWCKADYCWLRERIILEVNGGATSGDKQGGRHTRKAGYENDMWKQLIHSLNSSTALACSPAMLGDPKWRALFGELLRRRSFS